MPNENIILTASLKEVSFKLYVDDEYYMDIDSNSLNLVGNYQILKNGIYYNYDGSNIDANLLLW